MTLPGSHLPPPPPTLFTTEPAAERATPSRRDTLTLVGFVAALALSGLSTFGDVRTPEQALDASISEARIAGLGVVDVVEASVRPPWEREEASLETLTHRRARLPASGEGHRTGSYRMWAPDAPAPAEETSGFALRDALSDARVYVRQEDGRERACRGYRFGRWFCGPEEWLWVGPTELSVRGRETSCVWFHPPEEGAVVIAWNDVGRGGTLTGRYAFADVAADNAEEGDGLFVVRWNGEAIVEREVTQARGFRRYTALAPEREGVNELSLEFSSAVTSQRHFCFDGRWIPQPENP